LNGLHLGIIFIFVKAADSAKDFKSLSTLSMPMAGATMDMDKLFQSERENLQLMSYEGALDAIEKRILRLFVGSYI
jgi:hypothetical protein